MSTKESGKNFCDKVVIYSNDAEFHAKVLPFPEILRPDELTQHFAKNNVELVQVAHPDGSMDTARRACDQK